MTQMKWMLGIAASGLVIAAGGLIYGVLAVGVPHQNPTPAQAAAERMNVAVSGWAMAGGSLMLIAGLAGIAIIGTSRLLGRCSRPRNAIESRRRPA